MVKKFMLYMIVAATAVLIIGGCSNEASKPKNKYDDEINQVIKLENESLKKPGVVKDIEQLKRKDSKIEIFENGKLIRLTYEIRDEDFITAGYKKLKNGSYESATDRYFKDKQPTYVEQQDVGSE